jgi:glycosyltransferase involved in cell wall biosynthesis
MKIVHLCLSNYYIDDFLYQENQLVRRHVADGHDVSVIASTETFDDKGEVVYGPPRSYMGFDGAPVIRLAYRRGLPSVLARKVRAYPGVYRILSNLAPNVVVCHGPAGWELLTIARYVRDHPGVILHIDSHADAFNSAQSWASRHLLHGQFYRRILNRAMQVSGPLLCVAPSVMDFAREVYCLPADRIEFFPLGGEVLPAAKREARRAATRERLGITNEQILIVQSGKQGRAKKLPQSLRALAAVSDSRLRLAVAGLLQDDVRAEVEALMAQDTRVTFLGWQNPDQLTDLLCAADVYLQPGTQSATMQQALCCGCAVILDDIVSHAPYSQENGWFVDGEAALLKALRAVPEADLAAMQARSLDFARRVLDYSAMAERLLRP